MTLLVASLMLAELVALDTGLIDPGWAGPTPVWLRVGLLTGGLCLGVAGLTATGGPSARRKVEGTRKDVAVVVLVTAMALVLRMWRLDALRILIDEGNSIDNLFHARRASQALLLPPSQYVTTLLHPYWQALVAGVAGPSLTGLRMSSALLGAATVPAVYWLGRALYTRQVAFIAAALLAVLPPHLHFSRIGLPHVMDALFGTLALAGVARGLRHDRRLDWVLGGAALGLTHYGFEAGRLFYTPLLFGWLAALAIVAPDRLRHRRAGIVAMVVMFALTVLPLYAAVLVSGAEFAPRWRSSRLDFAGILGSAGSASAVLSHLVFAARVYVTQPERAEFYGGDTAILLPVLVPFFLLGLAMTTLRLRKAGVIVPISLLAAWLSNAAMRDAAMYPRWVVALPTVALATALGIDSIAGLARRRSRWIAVAIVLVVGVVQVHYYFVVHVDRLSTQARAAKPYRDAYDAVLRAVTELPTGTELIVISDPVVDPNPPRSLLALLLDGSDAMHLQALAATEFAPSDLRVVAADRNLGIFVAPDDEKTVEALRSCLPLDTARRGAYPIAADRVLALYFVAAGDRRPPCACEPPNQ